MKKARRRKDKKAKRHKDKKAKRDIDKRARRKKGIGIGEVGLGIGDLNYETRILFQTMDPSN
jgi:hypothetical protein